MLSNSQVVYSFSPSHPPALRVCSGAVVEMETLDCFGGQLQEGNKSLETLDPGKENPATGPIYVEGAEPGGILKASILGIRLEPAGIVACGGGDGPLGGGLTGKHMRRLAAADGQVLWDGGLKLAASPMVGVIGVAPGEGAVPCSTPGPHGGNLDNAMITTGASLYLPVNAPGALFALGDVHAAMGDGEIGGCGLEIGAVVKVRLEALEGGWLGQPLLAGAGWLSTMASAPTLDAAVELAAKEMLGLLRRCGRTAPEAVMLMSLAGQAGICQVVNPLKTARFTMPRACFPAAEGTGPAAL